METESAKSSNASSSSELANEANLRAQRANNEIIIDPRTPEEIKNKKMDVRLRTRRTQRIKLVHAKQSCRELRDTSSPPPIKIGQLQCVCGGT